MSKDFYFKDDSGNNFSCNIKSFNPEKLGEVILTHNNEDYIFKTNLKNVYINMMSHLEKRKFLNDFLISLKHLKISALYQEDKPDTVELSIHSRNMKPLRKELQEFSREYLYKNREKGNTYEVKLKMLTPDEIIVKDNKGNDYSFKYDLTDTHFYEYTEEERRKIIKYAQSFIKEGETIRITEQGRIGYSSFVDINYGNLYSNSLINNIREIIKPYQTQTIYHNVFYALVSKVIDGDTIEIFNGDKKERIRLNGIDSPEKKQAFGEHARSALYNLVKNKKIKIEYTKEEKYGRILGTIYIPNSEYMHPDINVNKKLVEEGYAIANNQLYSYEEKKAREQKKGIWLIDFEDPRKYREKNKFIKRR